MSKPQNEVRGLEFAGPALYRVVVQGRLSEDWSARIASMAITAVHTEDGGWVSTLEGPILDQAELSGVLSTLHALHLPLLRVTRLEAQTPPGNESDPKHKK